MGYGGLFGGDMSTATGQDGNNGFAGIPGLNFGTLAGLALPGIGGVLSAVGDKIFGNSMNNAATQTSQQIYDATKKLNDLSGYNAAGFKGTAVKSDYANAAAGLQNSAEARNAANQQNQMAGRMLSSQQGAMDSTNRNAQLNSQSQTRNLTDVARNQGMGGGGIAAIADSIGRGADNTLLQANQQNAQSSAQNAAGAANLFSNSSNILNADLANRNNIFVKPHEYQENNLAQAGLNQFGPMAMQNYDNAQAHNPLAGLAHSMGALGGGIMGSQFANAGDIQGWLNGRRYTVPGGPRPGTVDPNGNSSGGGNFNSTGMV